MRQEFNKGIFDHLIAVDDPARRAAAAADGGAEKAGASRPDGTGPMDSAGKPGRKRGRAPEADRKDRKAGKRSRGAGAAAAAAAGDAAEFGVVRGIDFKGVRTVVNVDAPESVPVRPHRCGQDKQRWCAIALSWRATWKIHPTSFVSSQQGYSVMVQYPSV